MRGKLEGMLAVLHEREEELDFEEIVKYGGMEI